MTEPTRTDIAPILESGSKDGLPNRIWLSRHYPCLYRLDKSSDDDVEFRSYSPERDTLLAQLVEALRGGNHQHSNARRPASNV